MFPTIPGAPKQLYTCDFEHAAACGFASPHGTFTWSTSSGSTPTAGTGPEYDHTKGHGQRGKQITVNVLFIIHVVLYVICDRNVLQR